MKKNFEEASELDGYEELKAEDQARVTKAWEDGHVADEDIPPSARKPEGEDGADDEEKPKKAAKKAPAKKKAAGADDDEEAEEKPNKKASAPKVRSFYSFHSYCFFG